jgi:branched-chain amino acid transport system substrate-binding protein
MKKTISITLFAILLIVIFLSYKSNKGDVIGNTIKIGAVYPLTGSRAYMGVEYKRGVEMAVEEINKKGGVNGKKIEVIYEDDAGDAAKAVTAVNKFIGVDKVDFVFTAFSPTANATAPIAEKNKTIYFNASTVKIGNGNYVFKDYWDMGLQGQAIAKAIKKEGMKKLGMLVMVHPATVAYMENLNNELKGYNIETYREDFIVGSTDYKTQLAKIKSFNPDAILVFSAPGNDSTNIVKQIIDLKMDNLRLFGGSSALRTGTVSDQFPEVMAKMKTVDTWYNIDITNNKAVEFKNNYEKKYNTKLIGDAAFPYDDVYLIAQVLSGLDKGANSIDILNQLKTAKYDGVAGSMSFDEMNNSIRPAYLEVDKGGKWIKYE